MLQRVQANGEKSDWACVTCGGSEESVLGPLFFTIYINDLDCSITNDINKFADDAKVERLI